MFQSMSIKQERTGLVTSTILNLSLVALILTFGAAVRKSVHVHHEVTFITPQLQVVHVKHTVIVQHGTGHSFGQPVLVTAGAARISPVRTEAVQPEIVKLDAPSTLELPQSSRTVAAAPVARLTGFGGTVQAGVSGPSGTIAQAGFGVGTGSSGKATGTVARVSFERVQQAPVIIKAAVSIPSTTSAVVLSIPHAHYTDAARAAHVTGDVILQVRFTASGEVQVLSVVKSPGYDLDREARAVAAGVRFQPATQNGMPVDSVHVIAVHFDLAS